MKRRYVISELVLLILFVALIVNLLSYQTETKEVSNPVTKREFTYLEPQDFYADTTIVLERKLYYENLHNKTE